MPRFETRNMRPDDLPEAVRCFCRALGIDAEAVDLDRPRRLLDFAGSFVAVADGAIVGTVGAYRFDLSTPGSEPLPAVGTTIVGVSPTHRRQGVLRSMMEAHLGWAEAEKVPLVGLWASETGIYGRFGYGVAARGGMLSIDRARAEALPPPPEISLAFFDDFEGQEGRLFALYDRFRLDRAGAISRSPEWWRLRRFAAPLARSGSPSPYHFVIAQRDGQDVGYAQYRRTSVVKNGCFQDEVYLDELMGEPRARQSLWSFFMSMDLVGRIEVFDRPVDEPYDLLIRNPRYLAQRPEDTLWLRPLNVGAFLEARRYPLEGQFTIDIETEGRWHLSAGPQGARATKTDASPDLELHLTDVPSLVWGERSAAVLFEAGRLRGHPDRIERASSFFQTPFRPWCPERF